MNQIPFPTELIDLPTIFKCVLTNCCLHSLTSSHPLTYLKMKRRVINTPRMNPVKKMAVTSNSHNRSLNELRKKNICNEEIKVWYKIDEPEV